MSGKIQELRKKKNSPLRGVERSAWFLLVGVGDPHVVLLGLEGLVPVALKVIEVKHLLHLHFVHGALNRDVVTRECRKSHRTRRGRIGRPHLGEAGRKITVN